MQLDLFQTPTTTVITTEEWKEAATFPRYECSTMGRFRNKRTGQYLSGTIGTGGYVHIGLMRTGKGQITKLAHRLLAETWLEKPSDRHNDVNHKNKVRSDNRTSNLEWATRSWNSKHSKSTPLPIQRQVGFHTPAPVRPPASGNTPHRELANNTLSSGSNHNGHDRPK